MKNIRNMFLLFVFSIIFSGCTESSNYDRSEYLENEIYRLEQEIEELELCQEEFQNAVDSAKGSIVDGYYEDAYSSLDYVSASCLY